MIQRYVGINLRGRNVGVAENGLHGAQICAILHHVSGATVAQHVRRCVPRIGCSRLVLHHLPNALASQAAAAARDE